MSDNFETVALAVLFVYTTLLIMLFGLFKKYDRVILGGVTPEKTFEEHVNEALSLTETP